MDASRGFPDDCLPPEGQYASRDEVHAAINAWAAPRGYAFVSGKSKKTGSGKRVVYFTCDRGGPVSDPSITRMRLTTTRRTGCQFSVIAKESLDKATWRLSHRQGSLHAYHNHDPSPAPSAHPVLRQLSPGTKATVRDLANAQIHPRNIRGFLRNSGKASLAT